MPVYPLPKLDPAPLRALAKSEGVEMADWAHAAGMHRNTLYKRIYLPLAWSTADRLAIALGYHPSLVWGDKWWAIAETYDALVPEANQLDSLRRRESDLVALGTTTVDTPAWGLAAYRRAPAGTARKMGAHR